MNNHSEKIVRSSIAKKQRLVIKLGTRVIAGAGGRPNKKQLEALVSEIADLKTDGKEVVLVSSGAIGAGMEALKLTKRPKSLAELQMCASVGQARLMAVYDQLFAAHKLQVGQVLLTRDGLSERKRYLNIRNTFRELFKQGIIPIVNENDVVSVEEICFGDNDMLAAMVSLLVDAGLLLLLTNTDGIKDLSGSRAKRVPWLAKISESTYSFVKDKADSLSIGGMQSKLEAAELAVKGGVLTLIADGSMAGVLASCLRGESVGSLIGDISEKRVSSKKKWLAFFPRSSGSIFVDRGASEALRKRGVSLLPVGITKIEGSFAAGSLVLVKDKSGEVLAKGLSAYSASDLLKIKGRSSREVKKLIGNKFSAEVVHRDNLVIV